MSVITITIQIELPEGATVKVVPAPRVTVEPETPPVMPEPIVHITDDAPTAHRTGQVRWTDEEDGILRDTSISHKDAADLLGREYPTVVARRYVLGINLSGRVRHLVPATRSMARWTEAEVEYIIARAAEGIEPEQIGREVGRSEASVKRKLK